MSSPGASPVRRHEPARHLHSDRSTPKPGTAWRVIHACEYARDVLPLVEGQIAAGMRPYIVTPQGAGSAELYLARPNQEQVRTFSLLRSWQDVRNWRKSILECEPESSADLVHAHAFAAGMAAIRSCGCVVYDLTGCIEELAIAAQLCEPGSWMGRSFRVAEQFILSRASAVVVHSNGMKEAALERGAAPGSIFVIPEPLIIHEPEEDAVSRYFAARTRSDLAENRIRHARHFLFLNWPRLMPPDCPTPLMPSWKRLPSQSRTHRRFQSLWKPPKTFMPRCMNWQRGWELQTAFNWWIRITRCIAGANVM